jgi:hypothetical protein
MGKQHHGLSIVTQSLDRVAFVAYLLGAVVPFVALAYVMSEYVLPKLPAGAWSLSLTALTLSIGVLSAAAFLLLRRVTWQTVGQMRGDNRRLEALLESSARLASAPHEAEVAVATADCAWRLIRAEAAFYLTAQQGGAPKVEASSGDRAQLGALEEQLGELFGQVVADGRPAVWGPGRGKDQAQGSGAIVPVEGGGALAVIASAGKRLEPSDLRALTMLGVQASAACRRAQLVDAQRNFFVHVTDILVAALDTHMDLQSGHARRVAQLSNLMGRELGISDARRQNLHFAALLHDVGMLRIDPQRLGDKRVARQHPMLGYRMLAPIQLWAEFAPFILHHHEWFDGNGYPDALAGEAIPLESRIIGLAEAFDSMTSDSSYKQSVDQEEAIRRIEAGSGTQFDPAVVKVFLDLWRRAALNLG